MEQNRKLPALLGYALRGQQVPQSPSPEEWGIILAQAARHKVLPTLACVLPLLPEKPDVQLCRQLEGALLQQMLVSSNQLHAAGQIQKGMEARGLYNMTLKGIHTKLRYPQDYMRSMSDLDILCKPEQNSQVKAAMEDQGYGDFQPGRKHDHYSRKPYILVEMHRELVPASSPFGGYYRDVWQRAALLPGCSRSYVLSAEDEYIFNLVHMAEHFTEGGVGLRFVMDVYVYETGVDLDRAYLQQELKKLGLSQFYDNAVKLAMHWFRGDEADGLTSAMAEYVLSGGLYGSTETSRANAVSNGGRLRFLLRACFPGYREMCSMYPWLERWPAALPAAWVIRAVGSLLHRRKNIKHQMDAFKKGDASRGQQLRDFYRACGL